MDFASRFTGCWTTPTSRTTTLSPPWLLQFFTGLSRHQKVPVTELPATGDDQGLVWEFFTYLQDISVFDCYDYGEWISVRLPRLGMLGIISIEHSETQPAVNTTAW